MVKAASSLKGWPRIGIPSFHYTLLGKAITCQIHRPCLSAGGVAKGLWPSFVHHIYDVQKYGQNLNLFFESYYCFKVGETSSVFYNIIEKITIELL